MYYAIKIDETFRLNWAVADTDNWQDWKAWNAAYERAKVRRENARVKFEEAKVKGLRGLNII